MIMVDDIITEVDWDKAEEIACRYYLLNAKLTLEERKLLHQAVVSDFKRYATMKHDRVLRGRSRFCRYNGPGQPEGNLAR